MLKFYKELTRPTDLISELCYELLSGHSIDITKTTLRNELQIHPQYPSLLALGDVLTKFRIPNTAARLSLTKLKNLPCPFLVSLIREKDGKPDFSIVKEMTSSNVILSQENSSDQTMTLDEFEKVYSGVAFVIEKANKSGEADYERKNAEEKLNAFLLDISLWVIPLLITFNIILFLSRNEFTGSILLTSLYQAISLIGWSVCVLIMWHEVDGQNKALKKVCGIGQEVSNCDLVMQSGAGKILGFSWGNVGFAYFSMLLLIQIESQFSQNIIGFIAPFLSCVSIIFVPFSIVYQKYIIKKWCRMCLLVQGILVVHFFIALIGFEVASDSFSHIPKIDFLVPIVFGGLIPLLGGKYLTDLLKEKKNLKEANRELTKSRFDASILISALRLQSKLESDPRDLGILLGNPDAKHKVIKVCNPYCGPCAAVHNIVDDLVDNDSFSVQIIFTATNSESDRSALPVRHFLSIAKLGDDDLTRKMLHDWYDDPVKDYADFAKKYPLQNGSDQYNDMIDKMSVWCNKTQISFTPTFFVDGHQLPNTYTISEVGMLLAN